MSNSKTTDYKTFLSDTDRDALRATREEAQNLADSYASIVDTILPSLTAPLAPSPDLAGDNGYGDDSGLAMFASNDAAARANIAQFAGNQAAKILTAAYGRHSRAKAQPVRRRVPAKSKPEKVYVGDDDLRQKVKEKLASRLVPTPDEADLILVNKPAVLSAGTALKSAMRDSSKKLVYLLGDGESPPTKLPDHGTVVKEIDAIAGLLVP